MSAKEYNPAEIENFIQESWKMHYSPNFSHSQAPWGWVVRRARPADPPPPDPLTQKTFFRTRIRTAAQTGWAKGKITVYEP